MQQLYILYFDNTNGSHQKEKQIAETFLRLKYHVIQGELGRGAFIDMLQREYGRVSNSNVVLVMTFAQYPDRILEYSATSLISFAKGAGKEIIGVVAFQRGAGYAPSTSNVGELDEVLRICANEIFSQTDQAVARLVQMADQKIIQQYNEQTEQGTQSRTYFDIKTGELEEKND
ncbi:MAG: hypothetical protein HYW78_04220 [Parcubacteria group bacterium]|nr:hypothetical protein [Parcubacteria group bacterium]